MHGRLLRRTKRAALAAARETPAAGRGVKAVLALWLGLSGIAISGCANMKWPADAWPFHSEPAGAASSTPAPGPQQAPASAPAPEAGPSVAPGGGPNGVLDNEIAMARLCERRGETDDARQMYCTLLKKFPQDPRLHHRLAVLAVQKSSFSEAEEHFRAARSRAPAGAELLNDMGYCCYLQGKFKEAEDLFRQALKADANNPAAITMATNNLGLAVGAQGRLDESLSLFKRVNSEAEAFANLAYVLAQTGQGARAQQMYLRALTLDNTMRAAAQAMLQVAERSQAWAEVAAANRQPPPATPTAAPAVVGTLAPAGRPDPGPETPPAPVRSAEARSGLPAANRQPPPAPPAAAPAVVGTSAPASRPDPGPDSPPAPVRSAEARSELLAANHQPPPARPVAAPAVVGTSAPAGQPDPPGAVGSSPRNDRPTLLEQPEAQPPCAPRGILGPTSTQQAGFPAATPPADVQPATYTQSAAPWPAGSQGPPPGGPVPQACPPGSQSSPEPWDRDQPGAQPPGGPRGILDPITAQQAWYPAPAPPAGAQPATYTQPVHPAGARTELLAANRQPPPVAPAPSSAVCGASAPAGQPAPAPETPPVPARSAEARTELPTIDQQQLPGIAISTDADGSTDPRPSIQRLGAEGLPRDTARTPATRLEAPGLGAEGQKAIAEGPPLATQTIQSPVNVVPPGTEGAPARPPQPNLALPGPMPSGNPGLVAGWFQVAGVAHKVAVSFFRPAVGAVCGLLALAVLVAFGRTLLHLWEAISPRRPQRRPLPNLVPVRVRATMSSPIPCGAGDPPAPRNVSMPPAPKTAGQMPAPKTAGQTPAPQSKAGGVVLAWLLRRCGWMSWVWRRGAEKLRPARPQRRPLPNLVRARVRATMSSPIPCCAGVPPAPRNVSVPPAPKAAGQAPAPKTVGEMPAPQSKVGGVVLAWLLRRCGWMSWVWRRGAEKLRPARPQRRPLPRLVPPKRGRWTLWAWRKVAEKVRAVRPQRRPLPRLVAPKRGAWTSWAWRKVAEKVRAVRPQRRPLPRLTLFRRYAWASWVWRKLTEKLRPRGPRRRPVPRQVPLRVAARRRDVVGVEEGG